MEAASLPQAPPAVKAPIHTQHTGQHGNDGVVELIPWSWPSGSHGATTPLAGWSWGQRARFWRKVHITLVEGQHRDAPLARTVGLANRERPYPRMPHWIWIQAPPGDLVKENW